MRIEWTDLAQQSLQEIAEYVATYFSVETTHKALQGIKKATEKLSIMPNIGQPLVELKGIGNIRYITYKQNRIYYMVLPESIKIIIVWDGRQDPDLLEDLLIDYFISLKTQSN